MVGWGFAFKKGFVIFVWAIVWGLIGGVIALAIVGGTLFGVLSNPSSVVSNIGAVIAALILASILSALVASIGVFASIVKVTVEGAVQQMGQVPASMSSNPRPMGPAVPAVSMSMSCKNCGASIPAGATRCPSCGANL